MTHSAMTSPTSTSGSAKPKTSIPNKKFDQHNAVQSCTTKEDWLVLCYALRVLRYGRSHLFHWRITPMTTAAEY